MLRGFREKLLQNPIVEKNKQFSNQGKSLLHNDDKNFLEV